MASEQDQLPAWEIALGPHDPTVRVGVNVEQPIPGVALDVPAVTIGWSQAAAPWASVGPPEARAIAGALVCTADWIDDR